MMTAPSANYSMTVRLEIRNRPGMLGKVTSAMGRAGGDIGAVDLVETRAAVVVRNIGFNARNDRHGAGIIEALRRVSGTKVRSVSDRLFRGLLDVRARLVNDEMEIAAARGIASIIAPSESGEEYVIPSVFDKRVVEAVAGGVARAHIQNGAAGHGARAADAAHRRRVVSRRGVAAFEPLDTVSPVNRPSLPRRSGPPRSGTCQARLWVAAVALRLLVGAPAPALAQLASLPRLGPAPNFALTTQQHDRLWLTQLRERIVVLTFFCTTCEVCPDLLPALLDLSRGLGAAASHRVFFVAVSVDPARDTAPVLRRFAQVQGVDLGAWIFLTGRPAEVDAVARWYGAEVSRDGGRLRHACRVTLIDGAGIVRARLGSDQLRHLPGTLTSLLAEPRGS